MGLFSGLLKFGVVVAALVVAVVILAIAAILDLAPAPPDVRKRGCMPVSLAAVLLVLALLFLILSAVRPTALAPQPFPIWPAVLCLILERAIALGWK